MGGWDASTALVDRDLPSGSGLFALAALVTFGAACGLVASIRFATSRGAPIGVLLVAATYLVPVLSHQGGPWSAGVVGLALLGLAWTTQLDLRRFRRLPGVTLRWSGRELGGVAAGVLVLDVVVALLGGRGAHGWPHLGVLAVLVATATTCGLVAGVAALADGAQLGVGGAGAGSGRTLTEADEPAAPPPLGG